MIEISNCNYQTVALLNAGFDLEKITEAEVNDFFYEVNSSNCKNVIYYENQKKNNEDLLIKLATINGKYKNNKIYLDDNSIIKFILKNTNNPDLIMYYSGSEDQSLCLNLKINKILITLFFPFYCYCDNVDYTDDHDHYNKCFRYYCVDTSKELDDIIIYYLKNNAIKIIKQKLINDYYRDIGSKLDAKYQIEAEEQINSLCKQ